ncbi:BUD3 Bud site selection protein 3 [Candida maltosa Xu316]
MSNGEINKYRNNLQTSIVISQLHSIFDNSQNSTTKETSLQEWLEIFPQAAIFTEYDDTLFEQVITMVFRNTSTEKISTKSITKFGISSYDNMRLNHSSRFWPSCENLLLKYQKSNVRRSLAIANLKNANKLLNHSGELSNLPTWDEHNAGNFANHMKLMQGYPPEEIGKKLLQLGVLQEHSLDSYSMDVVYDNSLDNSEIVDDNNKLVYLLGSQLDHLFDPLLEYSPEEMSFVYSPPSPEEVTPIQETKQIRSIIDELVSVQTGFTVKLMDVLQNFIIPLRATILNSNTTSSGITRLNQVFPPTIDEITRINRILTEALLKAEKINYIEVLKAMAIILPYLYKPFIRHEANLKNFYTNLTKFALTNKKNIFDNANINRRGYSVKEIDAIVTGSLMELPRMKLILKRLHHALEMENIGMQYDESYDLATRYIRSSLEIIDAFGGELDENEKNIDLSQRIFTPTGKILTELATNWPAELQYGWLSRKVVGIFELNMDVVIIFSDHLLFLTICDNQQYVKHDNDNDEHAKKISVCDALMHSLVNEKPLPSLESFPAMEVAAWCNIEDVLTTRYTSVDDNNNEKDYLRFLSTSSSGFKSLSSTKHYTRNYLIKDENAMSIIDLINKARVLHKSSPFHLFKGESESDLNVYYTAHDSQVYQTEVSMSPFVLFLNMKIDVPQYFKMNPHLQLLLQASFIDESKIQITGYDKASKEQINEFISQEDFSSFLTGKVCGSYNNIFSSYNYMTKSLIRANALNLKYVVNTFMDTKEEVKLLDELKFTPKIAKHSQKTLSEAITIPMSPVDMKKQEPIRKRKSIYELFKKKEMEGQEISQPKQGPQTANNRNISHTFIPRGYGNEYTHTFKPIPTLNQYPLNFLSNPRNITPQSVVIHHPMESPDEKITTVASTPSIDVSPDFKFPRNDDDDDDDPIPLEEIEITPKRMPMVKRIITVDSNKLHLKSRSGNSKHECYKNLPLGIVEIPADVSPNWEAISASRNSSIRSNQRPNRPSGGRSKLANEISLYDDDNSIFEDETPTRVIGRMQMSRKESLRSTKPNSPMFSVATRSTMQSSVVSRKQNPPMKPNDRIFSTANTAAIFTPRPPPRCVSRQTPVPREPSVISLSPSEMANELAEFIDGEFGYSSLQQSLPNISVITLTTSEEEDEDAFYSPNEEPTHVLRKSQSESSEATITSNRFISEDPSKPVREISDIELSQFLEESVHF